MKQNIKNINGGFLSFKSKDRKDKKGKKDESFDTVVKNTKKSEMKLIKTYEEMDDKTRIYTKAYIEHLENLERLDDYANFNGMVTLFKKVLMKDNIKSGNIDKSNPILFRNYMIEGDVMPSTLRNEHLKRQIDYFRNKYFALRDNAFIDYLSVSDITQTSFVINVVTIDNKKYTRKIEHEDFLVNKSDLKSALKDIIHTTKRNLKRDSKIVIYDEDTKNTSGRISKSIKSNKKHKSDRQHISGKKHINGKSDKKHISGKSGKIHTKKNNKQEPELNLFGSNSKKGITHLNQQIQDILKSKKRSLLSIQKTKSIRKKDINNKLAAEKKAYEAANPPSPDSIIEAKCKLNDNNETACKASPECFYETYTQKCKKSSRPPPTQGAPFGAPISPPPPPGLFTLPALSPTDGLGQKQL